MQNKILCFFLPLLLISFVFNGCSTSKPQPPKKVETPKWIKIQPSDTPTYTYGVGIAKDRESAVNVALNDVVSKLGVKVESSFTNKEIVDGYYSKSISSSDIKADVAKIRITNYDIEKTHRISFREYALLLKVDNKKFFNSLKDDISRSKENIASKLESSVEMDAINRYNIKKEISKECDRLLSNTLVAHELDKSFDKDIYFDFVANVKESYYTEANSLRFYIYGDKNSENFVKVLKQQLIDNGFNVVSNNNKGIINIKLTSNDNIANNKKIVTIKLNIRVTDGLKTLGANSFILKERYKSEKAAIYNQAAIHFDQDVTKDGIDKILGIGINQ